MAQRRNELRSLLHTHGYRSTPQRHIVMDVLAEHGRHLTAEEVYGYVQKTSPSINRATIYRTLNFLCELGVVTASEMYGQRVFEIAGEHPHHHLVCQRCGTSTLLDNGLVDAFLAAVERRQHFKAINRHLVLHGLCRECQTKT